MLSAASWPDVSVVVTCLNLETYIGEALRSVLTQDYAGAVEIIVVDDASTDGSVAAIESAGDVILVRRETNGGVLQAMMSGLARASHDIVFLLDGDDLWEAGKLRDCVDALRGDPAIGFVTHSLTYVDRDARPLDRINRVELGMAQVPASDVSAHLRHSILAMRDDVWLGSAMGFRRSLIDLEGFSAFVASLPDPGNCYQDWPLAYWIAAQTEVRLAYVPRRLFRYRLHGANHSGDAGSADRAARNFSRAANTLKAMVAIGERFGVEEGISDLRGRAASYDYLSALYRDPGLASVSAFLRSAGSFSRRRLLAKELVRVLAVLTLGPNRFARWAARRGAELGLRTS